MPLKSEFDVTWRGYRRSQVQFFIQQAETEIRILSEDRDASLSQVDELSNQLAEARGQIEGLRQQLDEQSKTPIDEATLSDRLRRMVRLANDEAQEIVSSARATAEHEWARAEQTATELRDRYQRLVAEADEWRRQAEQQRNESMAQTRADIERMAREAEAHRRKLDSDAELRRTKVEEDFEISMATRRQEAMRVIAESERTSREEGKRRVAEATVEAQRRIRMADEHTEAMRRVRQQLAERVRSAQSLLTDAEPLLAAAQEGTETRAAEDYVAGSVYNGHLRPWEEDSPEVRVPKQRDTETVPAAQETAETTSAENNAEQEAEPDDAEVSGATNN